MALYLQLLCDALEIVKKKQKLGKNNNTKTKQKTKKLVSFGVKSYDNIGYFINVIVFFSLQLAGITVFCDAQDDTLLSCTNVGFVQYSPYSSSSAYQIIFRKHEIWYQCGNFRSNSFDVHILSRKTVIIRSKSIWGIVLYLYILGLSTIKWSL